MNTWFESIVEGFRLYINYGLPVTAPVIVFMMAVSKKFNIAELVIKQLFVLYLFCVIELVFFPLPTAQAAAGLSYKYQLIPFHFLADFMEDSFIRVLSQVLLNVVMTVPFGMFLEYCTDMDLKKAVLASFAFTMFIELGQLTGLFFLFKGSYRLFDVDDLMLNTLGAVIGYLAIRRAEGRLIPSIDAFDMDLEADGRICTRILTRMHFSRFFRFGQSTIKALSFLCF